MTRISIVLVLALTACKSEGTKAEPSDVLATPADTTAVLTTAELYNEYAADHAGTFAKHKDHLLVVSGKTWGTAPEPFRVGLEVPDEPFGSILAEMDEDAARAAGINEAGADARLKCRWKSQDTDAVDISLSECTIAK